MKKQLRYILIFFTFNLALPLMTMSQNCVQCNGSTATGNNASAIGYNTSASGNNSLAGGYNSQATGSNSLAFGYSSKASQSTNVALGNTAEALGTGSIAMGTYVKASAQNSFVFGAGTTSRFPLTNNTAHSIAFGVNSTKPTMLITKSLNNNYTGKVAIGNVTPTTKLHIKSDNNEDASVFIEPADKSSWKAYIKLFDTEHGITVDKTAAMEFNSGSGLMSFKGNNFCFGKDGDLKTRINNIGKTAIYYNARYENKLEYRDGEGPSYAIDFNQNELRFRTATYQIPRSAEITNWRTAFSIFQDGRIGIGSKDIYLKNNADNQLIINSPKDINLNATNITLSGKIGINTTNNVDGYAIAVDGGLISNKVFIKEVNQWPDHVFSEEYQLMNLDELRSYLSSHKHLPGVPSQSDVIGKGYDVNNMQQILLEKIEELARYILLLQDEIDGLRSDMAASNDSIVFTYDADGNRISRSISFKRILDPNQDPSFAQHILYDLFPNPTSGQFSLIKKDLSKTGKLHASLHTMTGTTIVESDIEESIMTFDLSAHPSGVYLLEISGPDGHQSWKVIKR